MSLKFYLFCLIGSLVILLTGGQLLFIHMLKNNLNNEIQTQARGLSKHVIDLALSNVEVIHDIDNIATGSEPHSSYKTRKVLVSPPANGHSKSESIVIVESTPNNNNPNVKHVEIKQVLHEVVSNIYDGINKENRQHLKRIVKGSDGYTTTHEWVFNDSSSPNNIDKLTQQIQWIIALSALVAIIVAYWISAQFNKPLNALTQGFRKLSEGNYDNHVQPQGTKELKSTISNFNQMTEKLKSLQALELTTQEFKHLAELGEVSKGLAHALRNPIHTIGLSIEKLSQNSLSTKEKTEIFNKIQVKIQHINKTISALLNLTSSQFRRNDKVPLLAVIQDLILEVKASETLNTKIVTKVPKDLTVLGEESEVRSILHTLIINAAEADTNKHGITIEALKDNDGKVLINIIDQGGGLDEAIAKNLFLPHITNKAEGAGMGLYVSNRLISIYYDGELKVKNNDNNGCTATAIFDVKASK